MTLLRRFVAICFAAQFGLIMGAMYMQAWGDAAFSIALFALTWYYVYCRTPKKDEET